MQTNALKLGEENGFLEISLHAIPLEIPLVCPLYLKVADQFVLFRPKDSILTVERALSLKSKDVKHVFLNKDDWKKLSDSFLTAPNGASREETEKFFDRLQNLLAVQSKMLDYPGSFNDESFQLIHDISAQVATQLTSNSFLKERFVTEQTAENHLVNVATYSGIMGVQMKLPVNQVKLLILGAYLHDIGNQYIPAEILNKQGALTPGEREIMQSHVVKGVEVLEKMNAPKEVILTVRQHHENVNGTGYPDKLTLNDIHLFARIVNVADVYDALISPRPYHAPISRKEAIKIVHQMSGNLNIKIG